MKYIHTDNAPAAIGPYSQAVVVNGFVYCSGQIGLDPKAGVLVGGIEEQTKQALQNLKSVLMAADTDLEFVIKTTIFLKNMNDFTTVNDIYGKYFGGHKPARATVEVSNLPKGALVEIEAVAITNV